jgi:hypothetical protein
MDLETLNAVRYAIRQAMMLNDEIFIAIARSPNGIYLALVVVGLAGISETIGQSLVLFVNRIRPIRFVPAVLIGVFSYVVGYLLWTTSVFVVARYGFDVTATWRTIASVVGLAYAPQVLAFFELAPYFGNPFGILLTLWTMIAVVIAIVAGLHLTLGQAVFAAGLGWLLLQIVRRTIGRPANTIWRWFRTRAIGIRLQYDADDLPRLRHRAAFWFDHDQHTTINKSQTNDRAAIVKEAK